MFNNCSSLSIMSNSQIESFSCNYSPQLFAQARFTPDIQQSNLSQNFDDTYCYKNNNCDDANCLYKHSQEICEYEPNCQSVYCNKRHISLNSSVQSYAKKQQKNKYSLAMSLSTDDEIDLNMSQEIQKKSSSQQQNNLSQSEYLNILENTPMQQPIQQLENNNNKEQNSENKQKKYRVKLIPSKQQQNNKIPKCKFQNNCNNKTCSYYHYQKLCDLNERCCRKECYFRHTSNLCKYYPQCVKGIYCKYRHAK